tara:strand:- start:287 stop:463 length:177 start_codon:yes stop_codon:yes gene_type:complete
MPNSSILFTTKSEPNSFANQERLILEVSGTGMGNLKAIASNLMRLAHTPESAAKRLKK